MKRFATTVMLLALAVALGACGQGERRLAALNLATSAPATALTGGVAVGWPKTLPVDVLQPWEEEDSQGHVVAPPEFTLAEVLA